MSRQIYSRNSNYFSNLNQESAYFLGLFAADGTITRNGISINLAEPDFYLVETFKKSIQYEGKTLLLNKRKPHHKFQLRLAIHDLKLKADVLKIFNCNKVKTYSLNFPNIHKDYYASFLRGYFDGDGSITLGKYNCEISLTGTIMLLEKIQNFLYDMFNFKITKLSKDRIGFSNIIKTIKLCGRKQILQFLDYIYENSNEFCRMDRKYQKYLLLKNNEYKIQPRSKEYINKKNEMKKEQRRLVTANKTQLKLLNTNTQIL